MTSRLPPVGSSAYDWIYFIDPGTIEKGTKISPTGIDFGGEIRCHWVDGPIMVWHKKSHTGWAGVGFRATSPACYMVIQERLTDRRGRRLARIVSEFPTNGAQWRSARAAALKLAQELSE